MQMIACMIRSNGLQGDNFGLYLSIGQDYPCGKSDNSSYSNHTKTILEESEYTDLEVIDEELDLYCALFGNLSINSFCVNFRHNPCMPHFKL